MELVRKSISKWIVSAVVLVIGILCIVAGTATSVEDKQNAYTGISMTMGITLIVIAGLSILVALIATILSKGKATFIATGAASAATLATGIFFVADKTLGGVLIEILLSFIPYLLITIGSIVVVDGVLVLVFGFVNKNKKEALYTAIFEFVIAAITIVLGALMVGDKPVITQGAQFITFGIILIIYSLLICASTLLLNNGMTNKNNANNDAIDAEVNDVTNNE